MIRPESGISVSENVQQRQLEPFSITHLLKICEDQNCLLAEMDNQIGRFIKQLTGYEQELYEKDVYITKLQEELRRTLKAPTSEDLV